MKVTKILLISASLKIGGAGSKDTLGVADRKRSRSKYGAKKPKA